MILQQKNNISFFQFPNLAKFTNIRHGIFTRKNGYSKIPYHSLNVTFGIGDDDAAVEANRCLISGCMDDKELIFVKQVHGTDVIRFQKDELLQGDAIVTNIPDKNLVIQVADCQAVLMYDSVLHVVANVHSGWRGSIKNIIGNTVSVMKREFGCQPHHIIAGIGPSLGPCCAEFIHYKTEIPKKLWNYKDRSDHFDFWAITKDQLSNTGVLAENIYTSHLCTRCNTDLFFSYRSEKRTGRFAAVIGLK